MASIEHTVLRDNHAAYLDDFVPLQAAARDAINSDYFAGRVLNYLLSLLWCRW